MTTYWLETEAGMRTSLDATESEAALNIARQVYPPADSDMNPTLWLVSREDDEDEDYFLVPGGPASEEFCWMPRWMWAEGGPLAIITSDDPNKCPECLGLRNVQNDTGDAAITCPVCTGTGKK